MVDDRDATLFCLTKPDDIDIRLFIVEVYIPDKASSLKVQTDVPLGLTAPTDIFYNYLYAVAQQDHYLYLICAVVNVLYKRHNESGGIIISDRIGRVCVFHVHNNINDGCLKYIKDTMCDLQMTIQVARDTRLQGGSVFTERLKQLIQQGQYPNAINISSLTRQETRPDQATQEKGYGEKADNGKILSILYITSILLVKGWILHDFY